VGADAIELHTGEFAHAPASPATIGALRTAATLAAAVGLSVHAGHGLTALNLAPVAAIPEIEELNIGHSIVSRAIFVGIDAAVREVRHAMDDARVITVDGGTR
jgi:pyridoxine 5-phosphate synthase